MSSERFGAVQSYFMEILQLTSAIVGVEHSPSGERIIVIDAGVVLSRPQTKDRDRGFIDIVYDGRSVAVFLQDLNERAVPFDGTVQ
jgi:hypothetical protein